MTFGMDSMETIGGSNKDFISKKSRHEAIHTDIIRQATRDWIIASTYRDTNNMDVNVLTNLLTLGRLL